MNGNIRILLLCVSIVCGPFESEASVYIKPEVEKYASERPVNFYGDDLQHRQVAPTLYQTVNKYYCSLDSILEGSHLILFGTNGWEFPVQDVNLTLRYPPNNNVANDSLENKMQDEIVLPNEDEDYLVTGFKVIIYIDGESSQGYIVDGGVLQESITLSFVSSRVSTLMYEFWLYGARKDTPGVAELNSSYRLCY
ncbi:uncharacterized protein LOC124642324 isoform X2 [Helicoverpa zea]|uniref:uncharacterized protein LOC124642324 isoform X2 n=1 Tax=Helicoverpa zea TaxID=7113 RepID=UPI001F565EC4|nr:uncharacterized protein LOC124642324 isoform X2 [Helicoverpa zea]